MTRTGKDMKARFLATATAAMLAGAAPAWADVYGLVIGVDDYQNVSKLDGAVNDAKDIAQALRKLKAKDVRLLTDRQADRDSILAAWKDITGKAKAGDTVFLSFAGHGAQVPVPGQAKSQQFIVLPGFDVKGQGTYQRLMDAEFGEMLRMVPQLNVVFIVDSCHAGTMTRSYGAKPKVKTRAVTVPPLQDDKLANIPVTTRGTFSDAGNVALPHVVHLGAVPPDELDPEIMIDGKPRGALSYSVARALEGYADINKDGVLQPREMEGFVREVVRMATDGQQHPQIAVRQDYGLSLKSDAGQAAPTPPKAPEPKAAVAQGLRLAIINAGAAGLDALAKRLRGIQLVPEGQAALTWDAGRGEITSQLGDVVSYGAGADTRAFQRVGGSTVAVDPQADLERVQRVIDKMTLVAALKSVAQQNTLQMGLVPDDKLHKAGQQVAFTVDGQRATFLTLFNLSSDGTINFLYPLADGKTKDPLEVAINRPYRLDLKVEPPFGADHLVAIISTEPLTQLHQSLAALDGKAETIKLASVLSDGLASKAFQLGVNASFSAPQ